MNIKQMPLRSLRMRALEIKFTNRYYEKPSEPKILICFYKKCNLKNVLVTSIDKVGIVGFEGIQFQFLPAAAYAYTLGKKMSDMKMLK